MNKFLAHLLLIGSALCLLHTPAQAQSTPILGAVVTSCGSQAYVAGSNRPMTQDTTGSQCSNSGGGTAPSPLVVTPTDKGGTITVGGTSQTAIAANSSRKGCWIQNPVSASEDLFISSTTSATTTAGSPNDADLGPGGVFTCNQGNTVIQTAITVNAATTGHAFIGKETQ